MAFPRDRPWSCAQPKIYIYTCVCVCIYIYIVSLVAARLRRRLFGPPSQPGPLLSPAINMLFTLYKSLACSYIALAWLLLADRKLTRRPLSPPPLLYPPPRIIRQICMFLRLLLLFLPPRHLSIFPPPTRNRIIIPYPTYFSRVTYDNI